MQELKNKYDIHYNEKLNESALPGITVQCCGYQSIGVSEPYPPKKHPKEYYFEKQTGRVLSEYQLVYITAGSGTLIIDKNEYGIVKGDLFVLKPDQRHIYYPSSNTGWDEFYLGFSGEIADNIFLNYFEQDLSPVISLGLNNELVRLIKLCIDLFSSVKTGKSGQLAFVLMHILGLLIYEKENAKNNRTQNQQVIENAKIIMSEHIGVNISPEEVARLLLISYRSFRTIFKNGTGYGPASYMKMLKVQKAKQYLFETNMPVKEISHKLGYNSLERFVISFKSVTGVSPMQYRNSSRF